MRNLLSRIVVAAALAAPAVYLIIETAGINHP